jgi:hypothetical protein
MALAQQVAIQSLHITAVDTSEFPAVKVHLQAIGTNNEPSADLTPQSLIVAEDKNPMQFSMEPEEAGIRVVFVIDAGAGLSAVGGSGKSRISEMKSVIQQYLSHMNVADSVMVLAQEGLKTTLISDFSSSASDIQGSVQNYGHDTTKASSGYSGILDALTRLQQQNDGRQQYIVFLSSGIQLQAPDVYRNMVNLLEGRDHPTTHAFLFRAANDGYASNIRDIASLGGGTYVMYSSPEDVSPIFDAMSLWRSQYLITYRSPNPNSGNRLVVVTNAANSMPTTKTYSITLQPPQISIQDPVANSTVIRKPNTAALGQTGASTDVSPLKVKVEWPDLHPRKLSSISVVVGGQTQGTVANPTLDSSGLVEVSWDLRSYMQIGQNPVSLQVQATDELGITAASPSLSLIVLMQPDACKGLPTSLCSVAVVLMPYANFLAVGIALLALALVLVFRRQIASVGSPILERGIEAVTRLTKRRTVSTPKAYLQAVAGVDSGRTTFDLYGTTPIGRSRRHAELIFHATDEDSPISRLHCTLLEEDGAFSIRDEDSQWGTYLNNKKLEALAAKPVHDGDEIELGQAERGGVRLRFSLANPSGDGEYSSSDRTDGAGDDGLTKPRRR